MSDLEYDVLDELYFLQSFGDLVILTGLEEAEVRKTLWKLIEKEWIKCFKNTNTEIEISDLDFEIEFRNYHYLATKKGLLAHNGR